MEQSKRKSEETTVSRKKQKGKTSTLASKAASKAAASSSSNATQHTVLTSGRCDKSFYNQDCVSLAKALLGKRLVRLSETGERLSGLIVETEAYLGTVDKAAHSYKGKNTDKTSAMFMDPGTAYVYHIYGMYFCMNISSMGEGCAVLLRSLEPSDGLVTMEKLRSQKSKNSEKKIKEKDLCNGPSKLCQALSINKEHINKQDLTASTTIWVEENSDIDDDKVIVSKRINIGYAEDWVDKPLRFYVLGNPCVSVRDKEAEKKFCNG